MAQTTAGLAWLAAAIVLGLAAPDELDHPAVLCDRRPLDAGEALFDRGAALGLGGGLLGNVVEHGVVVVGMVVKQHQGPHAGGERVLHGLSPAGMAEALVALLLGHGPEPGQRGVEIAVDPRLAERLAAAGYGPITTEIAEGGPFYYAEEYHQQYLAKNPSGYCGLGGTGIPY